MSVGLLVCLSVCLCRSVYLCRSVCASVSRYVSLYLAFWMTVCLAICLFRSVCLCMSLSLCVGLCRSACLCWSVCQSGSFLLACLCRLVSLLSGVCIKIVWRCFVVFIQLDTGLLSSCLPELTRMARKFTHISTLIQVWISAFYIYTSSVHFKLILFKQSVTQSSSFLCVSASSSVPASVSHLYVRGLGGHPHANGSPSHQIRPGPITAVFIILTVWKPAAILEM